MSHDDILKRLADSVTGYDVEGTVKAAREALVANVDPVEAIEKGLAKGVRIVGEKFGAGEAFLTELMMAAEAIKQGLAVLEPAIPKGKGRESLGKILIGTVEGDIHDIGKSIVSTMLSASGFEVVDLGIDVPTNLFVEKVKELKPDIVAMSALMTTTMANMKKVVALLEKEGLRQQTKILIGGAPTSKAWAQQAGADAHATDAMDAVRVVKELRAIL